MDEYFFKFKKYARLEKIGPQMSTVFPTGKILKVSDNLIELGCPMDDYDNAVSWISSHRFLRQVDRAEIQQKDGLLVLLKFRRISASDLAVNRPRNIPLGEHR